MRICFLTLSYPEREDENHIYSDLLDAIGAMGHELVVFKPNEQAWWGKPEIIGRKGVEIVKIPTGRITKTRSLRKAINTILLERRYVRHVTRYLGGSQVDLVLYVTPPVTFNRTVSYLKRRKAAYAYLLLKDIFPQNAVDIGLIRKNSLIYRYFRAKEKRLYGLSDFIGCMSEGNRKYIIENQGLSETKIEVCPNSKHPTNESEFAFRNPDVLRRFSIPNDKIKAIYGGNIGKPQGVDFIIDCLAAVRNESGIHLVIVGNGTEYGVIDSFLRRTRIGNVTLMRSLEKNRYRELLMNMDIGLVFLDRRFTIPNYPSRILDYMDFCMPIIAATDRTTDLRDLLIENHCGLWSESGDTDSFMENIRLLSADDRMRREMGMNGRRYFLDNFNADKAARQIMNHMERLR